MDKKHFLLSMIFFIVFFLLFILNNQKKSNTTNIPEGSFSIIPDEIITNNSNNLINSNSINVINKLNEKNNKIKTICFQNISISGGDFIGFETSAKIFYEKDMKFRFLADGLMGPEVDIGSNKDIFWFYSRSMNPPYLFYASHENLNKTRLKTPFTPSWMMEILGVNSIDLDKVEVKSCKDKTYEMVVKYDFDSMNKKVKRVFLIDKKRFVFLGHYLFDINDKLIASTRVEEFQVIDGFEIPKRLVTNLSEENLNVYWNLGRANINFNLNKNLWTLPGYKNKVKLEEYKN